MTPTIFDVLMETKPPTEEQERRKWEILWSRDYALKHNEEERYRLTGDYHKAMQVADFWLKSRLKDLTTDAEELLRILNTESVK
jgi:hypothetical protein